MRGPAATQAKYSTQPTLLCVTVEVFLERRTVPLWLRYVDDTFTAVHKDGIDDFHEHLNRQRGHTVHQGDRRKW